MRENNTGKHHTHTCFMSHLVYVNFEIKQKGDKMGGPHLLAGHFSLFSSFSLSSFYLLLLPLLSTIFKSKSTIATYQKLHFEHFRERFVSFALHKQALES